MSDHRKIYRNFFGYGEQSYAPSELSGSPLDDIHHIERRGMGGSKNKNLIKNLMGLTRKEHNKYGDVIKHLSYLQVRHDQFVIQFLLFNPEKFEEMDEESQEYYKHML